MSEKERNRNKTNYKMLVWECRMVRHGGHDNSTTTTTKMPVSVTCTVEQKNEKCNILPANGF